MKIAIVTGGSRGIGRSAALQIARRDIAVILTYREDAASAASVVRAIESEGGRAAALALDVRETERFPAFRDEVRAILARWGREDFDALIHNAGYGLFAPFESVSPEVLDGLFGVHFRGPFFLTQALLPLIAADGHVVHVTSATTRVATAGVAPYAAFKSALESLTRYLAKELGPRGIRANSVSPGAIRTELAGGLPPDFERVLASQTALGRVGEPDDVGRVIAALLGEDLGWVNGQSIEVSGGYLL